MAKKEPSFRLFEFEHKSDPLLSRPMFARRVLKHGILGMGIVAVMLVMGVLGYHLLEQLSFVDALLNASMILGGMGPVNVIQTTAGKVFASCYALLSGSVILVVVGVLAAPIVHRILHRLHMDLPDEQDDRPV